MTILHCNLFIHRWRVLQMGTSAQGLFPNPIFQPFSPSTRSVFIESKRWDYRIKNCYKFPSNVNREKSGLSPRFLQLCMTNIVVLAVAFVLKSSLKYLAALTDNKDDESPFTWNMCVKRPHTGKVVSLILWSSHLCHLLPCWVKKLCYTWAVEEVSRCSWLRWTYGVVCNSWSPHLQWGEYPHGHQGVELLHQPHHPRQVYFTIKMMMDLSP